jgi:acyl-CoA thioesterase FadM
MAFSSPVTPRHTLMCETFPMRLGTKSITFKVKGRQDGTLCFEGSFTSVFTIADQFKSQPAPAHFRAIIEPLLRSE